MSTVSPFLRDRTPRRFRLPFGQRCEQHCPRNPTPLLLHRKPRTVHWSDQVLSRDGNLRPQKLRRGRHCPTQAPRPRCPGSRDRFGTSRHQPHGHKSFQHRTHHLRERQAPHCRSFHQVTCWLPIWGHVNGSQPSHPLNHSKCRCHQDKATGVQFALHETLRHQAEGSMDWDWGSHCNQNMSRSSHWMQETRRHRSRYSAWPLHEMHSPDSGWRWWPWLPL